MHLGILIKRSRKEFKLKTRIETNTKKKERKRGGIAGYAKPGEIMDIGMYTYIHI